MPELIWIPIAEGRGPATNKPMLVWCADFIYFTAANWDEETQSWYQDGDRDRAMHSVTHYAHVAGPENN